MNEKKSYLVGKKWVKEILFYLLLILIFIIYDYHYNKKNNKK